MTMSTARTDSDAVLHFAAKLRYETDPSDVQAAREAGERFALVDSRGQAAWAQGRIPGAVHLPTGRIPERASALLDPAVPVVVYCWGPGCNGSTKAALALARLGYSVREMIGGFEYWAREGLPVVDDAGPVARVADPLTTPVHAVVCDC
jgi:rhodanese-related sulfurtransferase